MRLAGSSNEEIAAAEAAPVWPALRALAPTLRYDAACLGDGPPPAARLAAVLTQPVGLPADFFAAAADATAAHIPDVRRMTIGAPGHFPDPALLGPILTAFYTA